MEVINQASIQEIINQYANQEMYIHLETTNGAYTAFRNGTPFTSGVFIRNGKVQYEHGKITGNNPYRVGLKIDLGWIYAEGLTHCHITDDQLLLAGLDDQGRLAVSFQLSPHPFK
ncbi:YojF family protein [Alkalihalobacterium alkalinitrilicum]|uniref:YojF family protein n=1 Tax=Alkalihalobacterium alkalinitrilicum TaxID=427920 RepID=UPI0009955429|nr:YojF family protein [Alkalihalobacterium alkalinitrilicum]